MPLSTATLRGRLETEVVSILIDKAIERPQFSDIYARICYKQIKEELRENRDVSLFSMKLFAYESTIFCSPTKFKVTMFSTTMKKKAEEEKKFNRDRKIASCKYANLRFFGQLYLHNLIPIYTIIARMVELLGSAKGHKPDECSIEYATCLLETIGEHLQTNKSIERFTPEIPTHRLFSLDWMFSRLEAAMPHVNCDLELKILRLLSLRAEWWRKSSVDLVSKYDTARDKELLGDAQTEVLDVPKEGQIRSVDDNETHWKDKYEESQRQNADLSAKNDELERKYRKLLMLVGRGKETEYLI